MKQYESQSCEEKYGCIQRVNCVLQLHAHPITIMYYSSTQLLPLAGSYNVIEKAYDSNALFSSVRIGQKLK